MNKRWNIAVVVQRYGLGVNGGAELHARWLAEKFSELGDVRVFTTCALDYHTWANHYPPGNELINGVSVSRYPVDMPRDWNNAKRRTFKLLRSDHTHEDEIEWMKAQGPYSTPLLLNLQASKDDFDIFIFFTYLYATTHFGLPLVAHKAILVPTAHDEPFLRLNIFKQTFNLPKAIVFNTLSEQMLVNRVVPNQDPRQVIIGIGVNVPPAPSADRFRRDYGIEEEFLLYVGRVDASKNVPELLEFYDRFKRNKDNPPPLVLLGKPAIQLPDTPKVISLGFVPEQVKFDALAAASLVVIPSLFESLSMIALEAWLMDKPILANGNCDVLKQQCRRSNGGLYYYNYLEFSTCLERLLENPVLRHSLGTQGHSFVEANYRWEIIISKYRSLFSSLF